MSTAFYIVLDREEPSFDPFVNGKALAKAASALDTLCAKLGLPNLDAFVSLSGDELGDLLDEPIDMPDTDETWFTPEEGLQCFARLEAYLRANPKAVKNSAAVLEDLGEFIAVLDKAQGIGARWHLALDF